MRTSVSVYHRHRFPAEIISHCVWLYFRFALSFRDVEEMLAMRGVSLSYETVREWCLKFGQTYANGLRHKSPRPGDQWHLDEVFLKINGRLHFWRATDQDGDVLDILGQRVRPVPQKWLLFTVTEETSLRRLITCSDDLFI